MSRKNRIWQALGKLISDGILLLFPVSGGEVQIKCVIFKAMADDKGGAFALLTIRNVVG